MERFDLCVSYRRTDSERARALITALQQDDVRVYADDGETVTLLGIQRGVQEYLARARLLAVFVDGGGDDTRVGHWFAAAALVAGQEAGEVGQRIVLLGESVPESLPPGLAGLPFLAVPAPDDTVGMRALVAALEERFSGLRGAIGSVVSLARPPWFPGVAAGPERFVGRHSALYEVHAALEKGRIALVVGEARGYQPGGQRAIGRTMLCQEYALRFGPAWPGGVFWLSAYGEIPMAAEVRERLRRDQLRGIAHRLGLPVEGVEWSELEASLARAIGARGLPTLWIVDDMPEGPEGEALDAWTLPDPLVRTLVVGRSPRADVKATIELTGLPRAEGQALLTRSWRPHTPDEEGSSWRIVDDLAGQPLALDACGGVIGVGAGPRSHAALRAALRKNADDVRAAAETLFDYVPEAHSMPVAAALAFVVDKLSGEARDMVRLATVLQLVPVEPALAESVLIAADGIDSDAARLRVDQGLALLEQAGVAVRLSADGKLDAERSVHPVWQAVQKLRDPEPWRITGLREALVAVLARRLTGEREPTVSEIAVARLLTGKVEDEVEASLLHALGGALVRAGDPQEGERAYRTAHATRERLLGPDHRDTLTSLQGLADAAWNRDDRDGAVRILEDVLAVRRDKMGDGDPGTLTTMNILGRWYLELGRKAEARALVERVLDGRRRAVGNMHPLTLDASARLAQILAADGDLGGAIRLVDDVMLRVGRVADRQHISALDSVVAVCAVLRSGGELNAARRILEGATAHVRRLVGTDDPLSIRTFTIFANVLVDLDDLAAARRVETDVLAALLRTRGETHPDTMTMMNNLGTTLSGLGEIALARQHLDRAWKLRSTVLGARHTDTTVSAWNLHSVMNRLGQDSGAVLAELEWLLDASSESLTSKQRKVRDALQELVREAPTVVAPDGDGPTWTRALLWVTKPFRKK